MRCSQLSPLTARALRAMLSLALVAVVGACGRSDPPAGGPDAPVNPPPGATICAPGEPMVELTGEVASSDAKTYRILPFFVAPGTGRIEVAYGWTEGGVLPSTPLTATTLDLGVWDQHGYRTAAGFRGWSGSRQGRLDQDRGPVFIAADEADRGYRPGVIEPGLWSVELGIAAVGPSGASWTVQIACLSGSGGGAPVADPVEPDHVAVAAPGWYHGDFHMHGYHSNPNAPDWDGFIEQARAADLDFLMVTEYVTGRHWAQLGPVQRANPDLLIWPGREIITYFGHANTFGETPDVIEYRHGFEDVTLGEVQQASVEAGALFGVNHPTTFEGALFENFCRGCAFQLEDDIDWSLVDTIEVQNGPARVSGSEIGLPIPLEIQNPFTLTALQLWDEVVAGGAFPTAVSGSDSKGVDAPEDRARKGYGSSATVVYAGELSRAALADAIRAGHAYVKTLGATGSPDVTMEVTTADGQSGIYGDSVAADSATITTTVTGGTGQTLTYLSDGAVARVVPILTDPFVDTWEASRSDGSGPLGTAIRLQVATPDVITVIGNPVFLTPPAP